MKQWLLRMRARWRLIRNHGDELNRRVTVENYLWACVAGKKPLPDKDKCQELAVKLGVPTQYRSSK